MFGCTIKSKCAVLDAFSEANEQFVGVLSGITMQDIVNDMSKLDAPFLSPKHEEKKPAKKKK